MDFVITANFKTRIPLKRVAAFTEISKLQFVITYRRKEDMTQRETCHVILDHVNQGVS